MRDDTDGFGTSEGEDWDISDWGENIEEDSSFSDAANEDDKMEDINDVSQRPII